MNLITNGILDNVLSFAPYSASENENVYMFNGTLGDTTIDEVQFIIFNIPVPKMVLFEGKNDTSAEATAANDGRPAQASLSQKFSLDSGKSYKLSYHVKYIGKGNGDYDYKLGAQLDYINSSSGNYESLTFNKTDSETEYRETYTFTMPANAKNASDNFRYTFNFWGAFVSGYIADFTLYEVDKSGKEIGDNLFLQGDFANSSSSPAWSRTEWTTYHYFEYCDIPENFFSKVNPYKKKMVYFHNTSDYSGMFLQPMLKPDTNYEFCYDSIITDFVEDKPCYSTGSQFRSVDGNITNDSMADSEFTETFDAKTNHYSKKFKTDSIMRMYGNNNMILRFYMRSGAAGYWANFAVYELDESGNRISDNLLVDGDFVGEFAAWDSHGDITNLRFVEIPDNFFKTDHTPKTMVYSNGTESNKLYKTTAGVKKYKKYYLSMTYVGMNSEGVVPEVLYPTYNAAGERIYKKVTLTTAYDSDLYYQESTFTLPEDALVENGTVNIIVQMNNNNFGKGYFTNMMLAEDGKYTNVLSEFTTDSKNYKELKYDPDVFVFYYDDLLFNDGDWSGEGGAFEYDYGILCGSVLDYDGNDLPEITMSLKSINKKVKLDEYGNFEFNKLSAGKYDLYLSDGEKDLLCSQVEIINGKTLNLPIIMYHGKVLAQPEETDVNTTVNTVTTTTVDVEQVPYEEIVDDGYDYDDYDDFGEETEELGGYGILNGIYYDRSGKTISGAKLYISKSIYAETNKKGEFTFGKLKPAEYGIYSKVGNKFRLLKKVEVKENKIIIAKVLEAKTDNNSNLLLIILICVGGVVFLVAIAFLTALFIKKRKLSGVKA